MDCERCGNHEAEARYVEVQDGQKRSRWLCPECARAEGLQAPGPVAPLEKGGGLNVFLEPETPEPAEPAAAPCPQCGTGIDRLHDLGLLGCPRCYAHFRVQLSPLLRRYHGATVHLGKAPRARGPQAALRLEIAQVRSALESAVAMEDFEQAATLRDRIAALQASLDEAAEPASEAPREEG